MQAILILVVIGVVIFLIYRASPGVRLQKADGLAAAKNWDAAISIYEKYFARNPDIPARIAKTLISMAEHAKDPKPFYQQVLNLRSRISGSVTTAYTQHESKAGLALATLHYEAIQKQKGLEERLRLLRENVSYIGTLHQDEAQSELSAFLAKHNYEIAKALYSLGQIAERAGSFQKARTFYSEVSNGDKKLMANILLRIQICNAKQALPVEQLVKRVVAGADLAIQNDYLYRLAVSLVKTKNFSRAETVVGLLQSNGEKNVGPLEEALQSERNKTLLTAVNAVNLDIEKIHGKGLTNKELEGLYQRINKLAAIGTGEDQNLRKQVHALRPAIFNRLLAAYREEKAYTKAFDLCTAWPSFHLNHGLLKNLAQCAAGMVRHDQITTENFEVAISAFVTACYSDRVILNSLEETSWDDAYTFTLRGALGSNHQAHKDLPENVNYSTPDEDNIAIGDTQRELIKQFETLLSTHIVSAPLLEKCLTTFHQELDTLSALASLLKQESLLCGPAFAKKNDLAGNLKRSLEALYLQTKNEVALDAAACYNTSKTTDDLTGNYVQARLCAQAIAKAFKDGRYAQVSSALYAGFENDLKQFKSLKEKTESDLELAIREAFRQSQESEALMHALEDLRGHIKASDSINRHYADLVANICIGKTNNDEIQPLPALKMMEKGYRASPNNSFVCRNLIALIRMNLMSAINDSHTQEAAMYTCMDGLKAHKSDSFKIAAQELADTRDEILLQLIRSQGSDFAWLLTGHTPNNITAAGRKLKKVIGYFNELSGTAPNLQTLLSN